MKFDIAEGLVPSGDFIEYPPAPQLTITVTSNGLGWTGSCYANKPGATNLDLAWKLSGSSDDPVVFASYAADGQGCIPSALDGTAEMTYSYDYQLTVQWDDPGGDYLTTIVNEVAVGSSPG